MTREHKLALLVSFALVMIVGVLLSDHFSTARKDTLATVEPPDITEVADRTPSDTPSTTAHRRNQRETALDMPDPIDPSLEPAPPLRHQLAELFPDPETETGPVITPDRSTRALVQPETKPIDSMTSWPQDITNAWEQATRSLTESPSPIKPETAPTPPTEPPSAPSSKPVTHTIAPGDTLFEIAKKYYNDGSRWRAIASHNPDTIPDPASLRPGTTIQIPGLAAPVQTTRTPNPPSRQSAPNTYTVKPGDVLSTIALDQLGTSKRWREIYELNADALDDPNDIVVGMTLKLPPKHTGR